MKILVDVDDVIWDLVPTWLEFYNRDYNDNLKKTDIRNWDITSFTKLAGTDKMIDYVLQGNIFLKAPLIDNSLEGIKFLRSLNHRVIFVTANDPHNFKELRLKSEGFLDDIRNFVISKDKSLIMGDCMIDDSYENVTSFSGKAWLFTAPWNEDFNYKNRVTNWGDIMEKANTGVLFK